MPPKFVIQFLRWFCDPNLIEDVEGDLTEIYEQNLQNKSVLFAKWLFAFEVIRLLRPGMIKSLEGNRRLNHYGVFKNYLKTTVRNASRERVFTLLNIFCLAIGFTSCLYVGLFMSEEFNFDKFHTKSNRIYRINQTFIWEEIDELFGSTGPGVMNAIWNEIPEFETMCRIHPMEGAPLVHAVLDQQEVSIFEENGIRAVDSTFFDVFTFPLSKGDAHTALDNPMSIILTEEMALKYFGKLDVLGEQVFIDDSEVKGTFQITGIAENVPSNSHVTFDILISLNSIDRLKRAGDSWWWTTFVTFGVLRPDADPDFVAQKVAQVPGKYLGAFLMRYRGITYEEFVESGEKWDLYIQPLLDIHLYSQNVFSRLNHTGDIQTIYIMATIAMMILLLSVINFINLTTARSARRSREVGIRKILGSNRLSLIVQFMFESILFCLIASVLSVVLLSVLMHQFNAVSGKLIDISTLGNPWVLLLVLGTSILVGGLAGLYPAFYLSSFKPLNVLKGQFMSGLKGGMVRNFLVTIQFTISIALIASALIVRNQVDFWLDLDLGYDRDRVIIVQNVHRLGQSSEAFKNELLTFPTIEYVSIGSDTPPNIWDSDDNFHIEGTPSDPHKASFWISDENFADIFNLEFIAGRDFDKLKDHTASVIVTRSLIKANGFFDPQDAVGRTLNYASEGARIVGIVEDFNTELGWGQSPMAYFNDKVSFQHRPNREVAIKYKKDLSKEALSQLMADIDTQWKDINSGMPMNTYFLDEKFRENFQTSIDFGRMMEFYSIMAILIAGLGLSGLVAYVVERKKKEVGIRKILGASVPSILILFSRSFGKLLLIGFVIASCISWYLMSQWVQDFDNQAPIPWYIFLFAGLIMLLVTAFTIGYQTIKSARANPVDSLRYE